MSVTEISSLDLPGLAPYTSFSEPGLYHCYEPEEGLFIAESPNVIRRALDAGYRPESLLLERKEAEGAARDLVSRCGDVPVYLAPTEVIRQITGFPMTRGALCAMRRMPLQDPAQLCREARRIAVLEEVVNPTNVGAVFRSAAAMGIDAVILSAGCADPLQRRASRVSMGTVFQVPWTFWSKNEAPARQMRTACTTAWPEPAISILHDLKFKTAAMALSDQSLSIADPVLKAADRLAIVLGAEGDGLSERTIALCDYTVRIPMFHGVDSLNVAAAGAVAFWELAGRDKV